MNCIIVGENGLYTPEEYQTILKEECAKAAAEASKAVMEKATEYEADMAKNGMTIIEANEIDIEAFKKAAEKAYEDLGYVELRQKIYEEIGK